MHFGMRGQLLNDYTQLVSIEDFADGSNGPIARNPLINTVLYLNKTIDSFGTGFGRVFSICKKRKYQL